MHNFWVPLRKRVNVSEQAGRRGRGEHDGEVERAHLFRAAGSIMQITLAIPFEGNLGARVTGNHEPFRVNHASGTKECLAHWMYPFASS